MTLAREATKGILDFTKEQIQEFVQKFRNRDLVFVEEPGTIKLIKEVRGGTEWNLFDEFLPKPDKDLRLIFQMGITLRKLDGNEEKLDNLRSKIRNRFTVKGLHLAEFVQNKVLSKVIVALAERNLSKKEIVQVVKDIWDNIDKFAIFIKQDDDINEHFKNIETRIRANLPLLLMIFGSGSAIKKLDKIVDKIEKMNFGYETIRYEEKEKTNKKIVLLLKQNVD